MGSNKVIVCVHDAGPKPGADVLLSLWREALGQGIARTQSDAADVFSTTDVELFYWADSGMVEHPDFDADLDLQQRQQVMHQLGELRKGRDFRRRFYDELPGKSPLKEFAMDSAAVLGLSGLIWPRLIPELAAYWQDRDSCATRLRASLADRLQRLDAEGKDIWLISHGMGALVSYEALLEAELSRRIDGWLTLGSPLSSNAVRKRLRGMQEPTQYPTNLLAWYNLAAEDDYVCHDKTVANDFGAMLDRRLIADVRDYTIYNLSVRYSRSNPHHSTGYLVHPRTAELLSNWLTGAAD